MKWLERYVEAVKSYLPKNIREDVGEEIKSVLQDKLEAEQDARGTKMSENDLKNWISTFEHPMLLAAGYQERRELVAAEVFPFYVQVLRIALVIILFIKVASAGFYILANGKFDILNLFERLTGGLIEAGLLAFGSITLIFHFLGRKIAGADWLKKWKVEELPETGHKWIAVRLGETVFEIIVLVFFLGFVYGVYTDLWDFWWTDRITLVPGVYEILPFFLAAIVLSLGHNLWLVAKPHWNVAKLATSSVIGVFSLWVLSQFLGLDNAIAFDPSFVADHPGIDRGEWLDRTLSIVLYIIGALVVFDILKDLYRIYKLKS